MHRIRKRILFLSRAFFRSWNYIAHPTAQWSNYEGPEGAWPPWKTGWPLRNTWFERVQGGLLKSTVKFNTWLQHSNIILSTDGAAPSPATWLINHAQFFVRRNQRCRLKTRVGVHTCVFSSIQIAQHNVCVFVYRLFVDKSQLNNRKLAGGNVSS